MELRKVTYSRRENDTFKVESEGEVNYFTSDAWNDFLNQHGTNPKQEGKRMSGSDSVNKEAFQKLISRTHTYNEFKQLVFGQEDVTKIRFHIYKNGLIVDSPVTKVEPYYEDAGVKVTFNGGNFHIWAENEISKCFRPANLIVECEVCFNLYNEHSEHIGYLYIRKGDVE
jgi:hypothetical protein